MSKQKYTSTTALVGQEPFNLLGLPKEIITEVIGFLEERDRRRLAATSKALASLVVGHYSIEITDKFLSMHVQQFVDVFRAAPKGMPIHLHVGQAFFTKALQDMQHLVLEAKVRQYMQELPQEIANRVVSFVFEGKSSNLSKMNFPHTFLTPFRQLKYLKILGFEIENHDISHIASTCKNIEEMAIDLTWGEIDDKAIGDLINSCKGIKNIALTNGLFFTDKTIHMLSTLPKLETMNLSDCPGILFERMNASIIFPHLTDLHLSGYMRPVQIRHFECFPKLKNLSLGSEQKGISNDYLYHIADHCQTLEGIRIISSPIVNFGIETLVEKIPGLKRVAILGPNHLTYAVLDLLANLSQLTELTLSLSSNGFFRRQVDFVSNWPKLREIHFPSAGKGTNDDTERYGIDVSNKFLFALAKHCPDLEKVSFNSGVEINDDALIELAKKCPHLREVGLGKVFLCKVEWSPKLQNLTPLPVSDEGIKALATYCKNLRKLSLSVGHTNVTEEGLTLLYKQCPDIVVTGPREKVLLAAKKAAQKELLLEKKQTPSEISHRDAHTSKLLQAVSRPFKALVPKRFLKEKPCKTTMAFTPPIENAKEQMGAVTSVNNNNNNDISSHVARIRSRSQSQENLSCLPG